MLKFLSPVGSFFRPMWRTIWIALAGQAFFIISVITMIPLRMAENPVVNYNLFYVPILALLLAGFFYRACVEEKESRGYVYGFFAALVAWPLIGEVASMPVDDGIVTQFSSLNIKLLGGYFYVVVGWVLLKILWLTGALKRSVCVFLLTFLSIWSFELYMDNYSSQISIEMMPVIANYVAVISGIACLVILLFSRKTDSLEKKTVLGCVLYITLSLFMMGSGQWKQPSTFYIKYEAKHIDSEIKELREEKEHLEFLKKYMLEEGLMKPEDFAPRGKAAAEHGPE